MNSMKQERKVYGYRFCILPSGNQDEFSGLDEELEKRRIPVSYVNMRAGGRIYRFRVCDLHNLPCDDRGPYFGDDESGHSIYPMGKSEFVSLGATGDFEC